MDKFFLSVLIVLFLTACGLFAAPIQVESGITGKVLVGPMCPVMIEGQDCPDQPYQATLTVTSLDGRKVAQFETDKDGNFNLPLAPGEYILHPESPQGMPLPFAEEQSFTVSPGEYTRLIVSYDSGIR